MQVRRAQHRRQVLRLGQVVVERSVISPGHAVVDDQARTQMPGILKEEMNERGNPSLAKSCLGHERIANANGEVLEGQLQDVVHGEEGCGQRNLGSRGQRTIEIPDNLRREQKDRDGLVVEVEASSSRGLPIATETYVM